MGFKKRTNTPVRISDIKTIKAYAKINLSLEVAGQKRTDGYHQLQSIMGFLDLHDVVSLSYKAEKHEAGLTESGEFAVALHDHQNLAVKALTLLQKKVAADGLKPDLPLQNIHIDIQKNIPYGAGLGGGSADAAAVLYGVNEWAGLNLTLSDLCELAIKIGADVPAMIYAHAGYNFVLVTGMGEGIRPLDIDLPYQVLLVKPSKSLSTKACFERFDKQNENQGKIITPMPDIKGENMIALLNALGNDLEKPACQLCPDIERILADLRHDKNVVYAAMTGSGTSCFALMTHTKEVNVIKGSENWSRFTGFFVN